jgi:hypothetical protein
MKRTAGNGDAARGATLRPCVAPRSPSRCIAPDDASRTERHALQIGLPPVLHFGSPELKARVAPECLQVRLPRRWVRSSGC